MPNPFVITAKIKTFRGASNGWQLRAEKTTKREADRLLHLLNRIQPQLIHKITV